MKAFRFISFWLIFACSANQPLWAAMQEEQNLTGEQTLEMVFVTNREGAEIWFTPEELYTGETRDRYDYGTPLTVEETLGDWLRIKDEMFDEAVYILKDRTGKMEEIHLIAEDLYGIRLIGTEVTVSEYDDEGLLEKNLLIELIDQSVFETAKSHSVNFLLADTTKIRKENGMIRLKCKNKKVLFTDNLVYDETRHEYFYLGQIKALNAYAMEGVYWEDIDVTLIDKKTGEPIAIFDDFPYLSADQKHIFTLDANQYEYTADFTFYTANKQQILHVFSASFKNWIPTNDPAVQLFWSTDGFLYVPVMHEKLYWNTSNTSLQYIRIKPRT